VLIQEAKICFFIEIISQLENEEGKNLNTNLSSKQAKQIAKRSQFTSQQQNKRNRKPKN